LVDFFWENLGGISFLYVGKIRREGVDVNKGRASSYKGVTVGRAKGTLILSPLSFSVNCPD